MQKYIFRFQGKITVLKAQNSNATKLGYSRNQANHTKKGTAKILILNRNTMPNFSIILQNKKNLFQEKIDMEAFNNYIFH